jgi:hypothetical protein
VISPRAKQSLGSDSPQPVTWLRLSASIRTPCSEHCASYEMKASWSFGEGVGSPSRGMRQVSVRL